MGKIRDLTNQKFGKWTVLNFSHVNVKQNSTWTCQCECGTVKDVVGYTLTMGTSQSCGCETDKRRMERNDSINLSGETINNIKLLEIAYVNHNQKKVYKCLCYCGNEFYAIGSAIKSKMIKSCGCLSKEVRKRFFKNRIGINVRFGDKIEKTFRNKIATFLRKYRRQNSNTTCFICNSLNNIHLHHLYGVSLKPELALEKDNLIELCEYHHQDFHTKYAWGCNTISEFIDYIQKVM